MTANHALHPTVGSGASLLPAGTAVNNLGLFDIVIVPTPGLAGNAAALAAFNRAALGGHFLRSHYRHDQ